MDDELKKRMIGYLDKFEAAAQKSGDFLAVEMPETIREWLTFLAIERGVYALSCLIALILLQWGVRRFVRFANDEEDPVFFILLIFPFIAALLLTLGFINSTLGCAKVIVAPRVVVLEQVADLVKTAKK